MSGQRGFHSYIAVSATAVVFLFGVGGLLRSCAPDAATLVEERGTFISVPDEGFAHVRVGRHLVYVRRLTPEEKAVLAGLPAPLVPYLNRDGVEHGTVLATVDTVLQGPENDILVLVLDGPWFITKPHLGDGQRMWEIPERVRYDALGRVEETWHADYGNLLSPTLVLVDGDYYIPLRALEAGLSQ